MKVIFGLSCIVLLAFTAIPACGQNYYYVRSSVSLPWGETTNEEAMDNVFGAGNWTTLYYETLDVSGLLTSSTAFIFLEGGDSSYDAFQAFMTAHGDLRQQSDGSYVGDGTITAWIGGGGRLLIMSAPNDPLNGATVYLPDNIMLYADAFYASAASQAWATDASNPIFSAPNSTAYFFTGDFFSHGYFTGTHVSSIMESNLSEIVLGQDTEIGSGLMVFGGMTTDNFDLPQPAAHSLVENIVNYTALRTW